MPYMDRLNYVSMMGNEQALSLAVEKLLGINIPDGYSVTVKSSSRFVGATMESLILLFLYLLLVLWVYLLLCSKNLKTINNYLENNGLIITPTIPNKYKWKSNLYCT